MKYARNLTAYVSRLTIVWRNLNDGGMWRHLLRLLRSVRVANGDETEIAYVIMNTLHEIRKKSYRVRESVNDFVTKFECLWKQWCDTRHIATCTMLVVDVKL